MRPVPSSTSVLYPNAVSPTRVEENHEDVSSQRGRNRSPRGPRRLFGEPDRRQRGHREDGAREPVVARLSMVALEEVLRDDLGVVAGLGYQRGPLAAASPAA